MKSHGASGPLPYLLQVKSEVEKLPRQQRKESMKQKMEEHSQKKQRLVSLQPPALSCENPNGSWPLLLSCPGLLPEYLLPVLNA